MTTLQTLEMALEALEPDRNRDHWEVARDRQKAITDIRQQIALLKQQSVDEPVAWFRYETFYEYKNQLARCTKDCIGAFPVYTTPPQRKPLTDEQIMEMYNEPRSDAEMIAFARAIEAAHGIKE